VALHGRKLHISAVEKVFTLRPAYKSLPQLLGLDFVINFATYTRVYTVSVLSIPSPNVCPIVLSRSNLFFRNIAAMANNALAAEM